MSLLEDVFLQDEAGEAQELERVIEGDEFEERIRSDSDENSEKEDEAEEDKRRVDPTSTKTRRVTKNPRFILNPARLTGPRGIQVIPEHFKDFKFKGKGHEKEDLDLVLKKLEHWAYRLYPKFKFEDCLKKIEILGKKRPVMVHLHKIRTDQYISEETVVQKDSSNEEDENEPEKPEDEFDKLLQQQIDLARSTPAPDSVRKNKDSIRDRPITTPMATSSPAINNEQRERMLRNRKLAEERRLARLKSVQAANTSQEKVNEIGNISESNIDNNKNVNNTISNDNGNTNDLNINTIKRVNRSNVIDSSDEEITEINTSVTVDVHKSTINEKIEQNYSINEDNSNNVLQMDTDSDTDIQNDNNILNNESEVNDGNESQKQSNVNTNDNSEIENGNTEENNDKIMTQINHTESVLDGFKNKVNDNDINKDTSTINDNMQLLKDSINESEENQNVEESSKNEQCKTTDKKEEDKSDEIHVGKDKINEVLMDVDFDDEF